MGLQVGEVVSARARWEALGHGLTYECLARVSARAGTLNGGGSSVQIAGSDEEGRFCGGTDAVIGSPEPTDEDV